MFTNHLPETLGLEKREEVYDVVSEVFSTVKVRYNGVPEGHEVSVVNIHLDAIVDGVAVTIHKGVQDA